MTFWCFRWWYWHMHSNLRNMPRASNSRLNQQVSCLETPQTIMIPLQARSQEYRVRVQNMPGTDAKPVVGYGIVFAFQEVYHASFSNSVQMSKLSGACLRRLYCETYREPCIKTSCRSRNPGTSLCCRTNVQIRTVTRR